MASLSGILYEELPNQNPNRIRVYPNEYINNITTNRPNLRLLANDIAINSKLIALFEYLGISLSGEISAGVVNIVTPPTSVSAEGDYGDISLQMTGSNGYLFVYNPLSTSLSGVTKNWGRAELDYDW